MSVIAQTPQGESPVRARLVYWRGGAHMVPALRLRGGRIGTPQGELTVPMSGGVPYVDAWDQKPPGVYFVYGLLRTFWPYRSGPMPNAPIDRSSQTFL